MKGFMIKPESKKYIEYICNRDYIKYSIEKKDGKEFLVADITRSRFNEILEDVKCEKLRDGSKIPFVTMRTFRNPKKLRHILNRNNVKSFHIYNLDPRRVDIGEC